MMKFPWKRARREAELEEEIRTHLALAVRERVARGEDPEEAEHAARREFGNVGLVKEVTREVWGWGWLERFALDVRYAWRQIRRAPSFSFFVTATLALGIGANTTIFSVIDTILLRALPYPHAERLVALSGSYVGRGDSWSVSYPNAADWRRLNHTFEDMAWYGMTGLTLSGAGRPELVQGLAASWNLFSLLGVRPVVGRGYTEAEDSPASERVVLLGYGTWQRRFGGDRHVIGRTLRLGGDPYTVIGVLPDGFSFAAPGLEVYLPLRVDEKSWTRAMGGLQVIGRLRAGVTLASARRDLKAVSSVLEREYPADNRELTAYLTPMADVLYGGAAPRRALWTLFAAVGFVLLIACVNVANLLLARGTTREREVALRTALGAARWRVLRQLLTESVVLAALGGVGGVLLALWGTHAFGAAIPESSGLPRVFRLDRTALAFTAGLTLLTGIAFGLLPAVHAARPDVAVLIGGRSGQAMRGRDRRRGLLVIGEVALAAVLLVCAGLAARSLSALIRRSPGFDPHGLLTFRVSPDSPPTQVDPFREQVLERLRALPGVQVAGVTDFLPLAGMDNYGNFDIEGRADARPLNAGNVFFTAGYLKAMSIPLLAGRDIDEHDTKESPPVVLINRTAARAFFGAADPIGRRLHAVFDPPGDWRTIVGVIGDIHFSALEQPPRAEVYIPMTQLPFANANLTFVLRTAHDPITLVPAVQRAVWSVDPAQAIYDLRTMQRLIADSGSVPLSRLLAEALAAFGMLALVLAGLGLYGVISYGVAQRTYEIGVRSALGAGRGEVLRLILRQGMTLAGVGLALGALGALAATRLMRGLLFGVSATDPTTFLAMAAVLATVALLATWLPARRAAAIEPMRALRAE